MVSVWTCPHCGKSIDPEPDGDWEMGDRIERHIYAATLTEEYECPHCNGLSHVIYIGAMHMIGRDDYEIEDWEVEDIEIDTTNHDCPLCKLLRGDTLIDYADFWGKAGTYGVVQ